MPRQVKGARLYLRDAPGRYSGQYKIWVIRDGTRTIGTGCREGARAEAEGKLGEYITAKHQAPRRQRAIDEIPIADVLALYHTDKVPHLATAVKASARVVRLIDWWGDYKLGEVSGKLCRKFADERGHGAARRELQDLQAAINYHHAEGYHREVVKVTLPPAGLARERWLTRAEAAKLLRICLHHREKQGHEGTRKRPLRHLARFILFALYTGSRPGDCLSASFRLHVGGFVDTERGLYHRRPIGKRATKKRQPTIPLRGSILAHVRRWEATGGSRCVVEFDGSPIQSMKTAWHRLIELAGPEFADVVPYTMRHTAITWMLQRGVKTWEVAGYVGTSEAMIDRVYGHHSPDHLKGAAGAYKRRVG